MKPITIEFTVKAGDDSFKEDSVTFVTPEDMFAYIAPGGGCDQYLWRLPYPCQPTSQPLRFQP